jgi:hypothetical protein
MLQRGEGVSAAIRSGILSLNLKAPTYIVCVNDIVDDEAYWLIEGKGQQGSDLVIPSVRLTSAFNGGCLRLSANMRSVLAITEKPLGGCPVGSPANILIHRFSGEAMMDPVIDGLDSGLDYESSINQSIDNGGRAEVLWLKRWAPIKTPEDYLAARKLFEK